MRRRLLVLALVFAVVYAGMYAVSSYVAPPSAIGNANPSSTVSGSDAPILIQPPGPNSGYRSAIAAWFVVAAFVTFIFGMVWLAWHTIKAGPWAPRTRAREMGKSIAVSPWWLGGSVDCAGGSSEAGGCSDF